MNESIVNQVKEALAPVAEKLQQGAEFLYEVFYRQTLIEGILQIAGSLVFIVAISIVMKKLFRYLNECRKEQEKKKAKAGERAWAMSNDYPFFIGMVIAGYITIICVASGVLVNGALKVGNPHYYTIERIIESVKSKDIK